jgi:hypothetical protein
MEAKADDDGVVVRQPQPPLIQVVTGNGATLPLVQWLRARGRVDVYEVDS